MSLSFTFAFGGTMEAALAFDAGTFALGFYGAAAPC
jgi:hypothetical protein